MFINTKVKKTMPEKKSKKKRTLKIILFSFLLFCLFFFSFTGAYGYFQLSKIHRTKISHSNKDLGISDQVVEKTEDSTTTNIALFAVDRRNTGENGNSDTIIIASIDKKHKKIKLSSIMRDSRVSIDGYGMNKINAAYQLGGPQLAIKTINQNFDTDIHDFVTVDFFSMEKIIDDLGGVSVNVDDSEIPVLNECIAEVDEIENSSSPRVRKSGEQTLSGRQAVAYARIRYVGRGDYQRTERQRTVLTAILNKINDGGILRYPGTVAKLLPYVETSFSNADILGIGKNVLTSGIKTIDQSRFPTDSACSEQSIDGLSYIVPDLEKTKAQIYSFIYDDIKPE